MGLDLKVVIPEMSFSFERLNAGVLANLSVLLNYQVSDLIFLKNEASGLELPADKLCLGVGVDDISVRLSQRPETVFVSYAHMASFSPDAPDEHTLIVDKTRYESQLEYALAAALAASLAEQAGSYVDDEAKTWTASNRSTAPDFIENLRLRGRDFTDISTAAKALYAVLYMGGARIV